jgi:hypothetical protein
MTALSRLRLRPWQDFDKTEMSLGPGGGLQIGFGAGGREGALRRMAADSGKTPAEALEDLIAFALDDDAAIARRTLRIVRKQKEAGKRLIAAAHEMQAIARGEAKPAHVHVPKA